MHHQPATRRVEQIPELLGPAAYVQRGTLADLRTDVAGDLGAVPVGEGDVENQHVDPPLEAIDLRHGAGATTCRRDLVALATEDLVVCRADRLIVVDKQDAWRRGVHRGTEAGKGGRGVRSPLLVIIDVGNR